MADKIQAKFEGYETSLFHHGLIKLLVLEELKILGRDDPDLCRNATEYKYNHKYKYATEITLHFINIKELKFAYR